MSAEDREMALIICDNALNSWMKSNENPPSPASEDPNTRALAHFNAWRRKNENAKTID